VVSIKAGYIEGTCSRRFVGGNKALQNDLSIASPNNFWHWFSLIRACERSVRCLRTQSDIFNFLTFDTRRDGPCVANKQNTMLTICAVFD